jgi:Tfp pilus assembly protein PilF
MRHATCLVIVLLVLAAVGCSGPEAKLEKYRARAHQYMEEKNWGKARVELRNALKIDPKDVESYYLAAEVEGREGNWRNAFGDFLKVVELDPHHREALLKLGRFYLAAGDPEKAEGMADRILADHPGDPAAELLKVAIIARSGRVPDAVAKAEAIRDAHPDDAEAAGVVATLYATQGREHDAEAELRRGLIAHPRELTLLNALSALLLKQDRRGDAEHVLRQMIDIEPDEFEHRVKLAAVSDLAAGEAVLREAITRNPKDEQRRLALAEYLATRGRDLEKSEAALAEARRDLPNSSKIVFALGRFYEAHRRADDARAVYEEVVEKKKEGPLRQEAQAKLAALDLAAGSREKAEARLAEVLQENPLAADSLRLRARIALGRGDAGAAVQDLRTVLRDQPDSVEAYALLGHAHAALGENSLARESLEKAAALDPRRADVRRSLARLDAAEGKTREARARLDALLNDAPADVEALRMALSLDVAEKHWSRGEQTLARLKDAGDAPVTLAMAEGQIAQSRDQLDRARAAYERAAAIDRDSGEPLLALTELDMRSARVEQAHARLTRLIADRPDHPYAHGILGSVLRAKKDDVGAEREFREAVRIKPDWLVPWVNLAGLKSARKQPDQAVLVLEAGLTANPRSEELRLLLAGLLNERGDVEQTIAQYDAILKENPKSVIAANNLAQLLADRKGDPQSLARALALAKGFEDRTKSPALLDTAGWVYLKVGQTNDAIRLLTAAAKQLPEEPVVNYHLGMAHHRAGDAQQAKAYLTKSLKSGRTFAGDEEAKALLASLRS